jgi:uncharacterized repeat protein (TIGR03843 family)
MLQSSPSRWFEPELLESILTLLHEGEIEVVGQVTWGSNYTFLVQLEGEAGSIPAIYKPEKGERPLWDFPHGSLSDREVAAYLISQALGWALVPPTIKREDAPAGPGSLQFYVEADPDLHYFTFSEEQKQYLRPTAVFDLLINNADRKSGHILIDDETHIWLIDHGVSFHEDYKLRTVVWDFVGEAIPEHLLEDLRRFIDELSLQDHSYRRLCACLAESEVEALMRRAQQILEQPEFPQPGPGRPYPWPLV